MTLNNSATFTAGGVVLVGESGAQGTINLNGGVFTAPAFVTGAIGSVATIDFNGVPLKAAPVSDPNLLYYYDAVIAGPNPTSWATGAADFIQGANFTVNVMEGGAKIDTNGLDVTITRSLQHAGAMDIDGGLTKLDGGKLTLTGPLTYTGTTTIDTGALQIDTLGAVTLSTITGAGTLGVGSGTTLTATSITVDTLIIGA